MDRIIPFRAEDVAIEIGVPLEDWAGNCYGIAKEILDTGMVEGKLCYGHWNGPVARGTLFYGRAIIHHAWIETDDLIIDPTRWVFERTEPYIWVGQKSEYYDVGGDVFRLMNLSPCPAFDPDDREVELRLRDDGASALICRLTGRAKSFSVNQLFWLANLPRSVLGEYARSIYETLDEADCRAMIPIDNYRYVME